MHPADHMSIDVVYNLAPNRTSGGLTESGHNKLFFTLIGLHLVIFLPVPQSDHLGRVTSDWDTEGPSEAEICQLEFSGFVDEQILRFQITVKDVPAVTIRQTS